MVAPMDGRLLPDRYTIKPHTPYNCIPVRIAADKISDKEKALIAVRNLSSYELRNMCGDMPTKWFRDPDVLIALMQRIAEPDFEQDEWDSELSSGNVTHMSPYLRNDLLAIFKAATRSFPNTKSFADFMKIRIDMFGYEIVGQRKSAIDSLKNSVSLFSRESGHFSPEDIGAIYSLACLCPADLMYELIEICLTNESAIPAIVQLIANELKSCASGRAQEFDQNLLVTVLVQHVYFTRQADVPLKISHIVQCILKETADDPVLKMESIVSELIVVYDYVEDMAHLIAALIHLIEIETGHSSFDDEWKEMDVVSLLKFFNNSLLDICDDPVTKEKLLLTIDLIIRNHIRRIITDEEVDEVAQMYHNPVNRLPLCYLQPYTKSVMIQTLGLNNPDPIEVLLLVALLDRDDMHNEFRYTGSMGEEMKGLLPYMTTTEWSRVFRYLIHFFEPTNVMCRFLKTCSELFSDREVQNTDPILKSLEHVFRQHYGCGANQETLPIEFPSPDSSSTSGNSSDDERRGRHSRSSSNQPESRRSRRKMWYFKEIVPVGEPYSVFRVLHLLLMVEKCLIPDERHVIVEVMVTDFMKEMMRDVGGWGDPRPSPARSYKNRPLLWWSLTSEQRDHLIQLDPELSCCNKQIRPVPRCRKVYL